MLPNGKECRKVKERREQSRAERGVVGIAAAWRQLRGRRGLVHMVCDD